MKKDPYAPLRDQLDQPPTHWRSLEHKEADPELVASMDQEFPTGLTSQGDFNRRDALKLGAAALSLGALAGCESPLPIRRPAEEILPFVKMPEQVIPGVRMYYATATQRSEGALGLIVEANQGRPTKIEGNPNHPSSLGASDVWAQAEVLKLYDPERARNPLNAGAASTWEKFDAAVKESMGRVAGGKGLAVLAEADLGPTGERLLKALVAKLPETKVYRWDPLAADQAEMGAQLAFGPGARVHFDLSKTKIIFSLDSDFLVAGPDHLRLARQFGETRAVHSKEDLEKMHRLYAVEAAFTATGSNADHRLRMPSSQGVDVLKALAKALAAAGLDVGVDVGEGNALPENGAKFVASLAKDLLAHKGAATILVGERQPAAVHALAYALNAALGGGQSVSTGDLVARTGMFEQLTALTKSLNDGAVDTLLVIDANPLYSAPGALKFGEAFAKAKATIHLGVMPEETGLKATWHAPLAHFLESWGDASAWDGTVSLVQPLIVPIFGARPLATHLAMLAGEAETSDKKQVEATWRGAGAALNGEKAWRKALHDGVVPGTARPPATLETKKADVAAAIAPLKGAVVSTEFLELVALHGHAKDGRLTNVSWIMELPDTISKLVWDNAVLMSPTTAQKLGVDSGMKRNSYTADVVEVSAGGRKITAPVFVLPGLSPTTVVMNIGYGRTWGEVSKSVGVDVNPLLDNSLNVVTGVKVTKTGATQILASTQDHFAVPGNPFKELTFAAMTTQPKDAPERKLGLGFRPLFRSATGTEFAKDEKFAEKGNVPEEQVEHGGPKHKPAKLKQPTDEILYEGQQWGMVIDLSSCIGCNICSVACTAENNVPVVGREQVLLGREMHWIRVDRYFTGDIDTPTAVHQPVACQHCENAPCEPVCPVSATVHDEEGINGMAYNRCIGTRYCANNCPYKVRRFNYFDMTHTGNVYVKPHDSIGRSEAMGSGAGQPWPERMKTLKLQRNPDVTVRYRGVMEKCTYCTQRVEEAKIAAKRRGEDRKKLPDGAVTPACAQACPTKAITFGNINDEKARVHELKQSERNYELLQELNVRPRTSYLARVRNENEELS